MNGARLPAAPAKARRPNNWVLGRKKKEIPFTSSFLREGDSHTFRPAGAGPRRRFPCGNFSSLREKHLSNGRRVPPLARREALRKETAVHPSPCPMEGPSIQIGWPGSTDFKADESAHGVEIVTTRALGPVSRRRASHHTEGKKNDSRV